MPLIRSRIAATRLGSCGVPGLALLASASAASAQSTQPPEASVERPVVATTLGIGQALGWPGANLEYYVLDGRVSAAVGAGYVPEGVFNGRPSSVSYSGRARGYLGSGTHRAALELSVSLVYFEWITEAGALVASHDDYGPGASLAYRYTSTRGLHLDVSVGLGWAGNDGLNIGVGVPDDIGNRPIAPIASLGVGYTWLR